MFSILKTQRHHQNQFCNQFPSLIHVRTRMTSLTYNVHIQNIEDKLLNEQNPPIPMDRAHRVVLGTNVERLEQFLNEYEKGLLGRSD